MTASTVPTPDLTLPPREPGFINGKNGVEFASTCRFDEASFAVYSVAPGTTGPRLAEIASIPQAEWEDIEMESRLARPAEPAAQFAGRPLADVVAAHVAMDKGVRPQEVGASEIGWHPEVLIVVVRDGDGDLESGRGLLLVYAERTEEARLDRFFFKAGDMYMLLSGILLGSHGLRTLKEWYDVDGAEYESHATDRSAAAE